ncbi:hypothetical protein CNQ82_06590 [Staphylococcus debuckii]|nr:hypothetical protein CNQ82_06590 [Staphylococcus debuckii]
MDWIENEWIVEILAKMESNVSNKRIYWPRWRATCPINEYIGQDYEQRVQYPANLDITCKLVSRLRCFLDITCKIVSGLRCFLDTTRKLVSRLRSFLDTSHKLMSRFQHNLDTSHNIVPKPPFKLEQPTHLPRTLQFLFF